MLELLTDHTYEIAAVAIAGLGAARFYYGPEFHDVAWQPLRTTIVPIAHRIAERKLGEEYYAAYSVDQDEHVATLEADPDDVVTDFEAAGYVEEPLAAVKTDWNGNEEVASYARHRGSKPFPGAPGWLRERQVHVTLFPTPDGDGTIVTAHEEYNSWRPDRVEEHYRGETMDVDLGRELAADDLGVDLEDPDMYEP